MISRAGTSAPRLSVREGGTPEQGRLSFEGSFKAQSGDTFHVHIFSSTRHMRMQG
jgi:hypothetical protein